MAAKDPRPDWRQGNKRAAGATPTAGAGKRDWQRQSTPTAGPKKPWSRGSKLALAAALLSVCVGGVVAVILMLKPASPTGFVLMGSSYDENLAIPHNAFGWKNLEELSKIKDEPGLFTDNAKPSLLHFAGELKGAESWQKEWEKFHRKIQEKVVVIFLALHGAADSNGPYFFLGDDQGYARLPLAEVLKSLEVNQLSDKDVVLILEPAIVRANWSAGVLDNTFVAKLKELKPKLKSKLFILCASDEYQTSWPSEEWQQTVFGHYVVEGLRGAADGAADGTSNGRVTVLELARYVNEQVVNWSQRNRSIEQTPILIGDEAAADKVEIAQVASSYKELPGEAPGLGATLPDSLRVQWEEWRKLREMSPHPGVYSPALWRRYQELLVRYEQLLRAGDPTKKTGDIAGRLATMRKKLEAEARFEPAEAALSLSLPMDEALGNPNSKLEAELRIKIQKIWDSDKGEQRAELLKDLIDWAKRQDGVNWSQSRVQIYRALLKHIGQSQSVSGVDFVGVQAGKDDPRPKVVALLDLFDSKLGPPRPAEVHYLTMLLKDVSRTTPPEFDQLRDSLAIRLLAERAMLSVDTKHPYSEVIHPWNRARIVAADAARRPGEDLLFASTKLDWDKSAKFLKKAQEGYQAIQNDSAMYRKGLDARDRATAELPFYALWVANQRVSTDKTQLERVDDWVKRVGQYSPQIEALNAELSKEKGAAPSAKALRGLVEQVEESQAVLQTALGGEIAKARSDTHSHPLWFDREAILSVPPLLKDEDDASAVDSRLAMLDLNRATSARFFKTQKTDKAFGGQAKADAETLAKRNQQMAMAAFKNYWPQELTRVENDAPTQIADTMGTLVKRWPADINEGLSQSLKEVDLAAAMQYLRKADFLSRGLPGGFEDRADPVSASQELRALRMHDLFVAQARRAMLDHWYSEGDGTPYYETAAKGFLNVARQLAEVKGETRDRNKLRTAACTRLIDAVKTDGIRVGGKDADSWTSEKEFLVRWTIVTPDDPYAYDPKAVDDSGIPPPAIAVAWRELEGPGAWGDDFAGQRKAIELMNGASHEFPSSYFLTKAQDNKDDSILTAKYNVLLRGQMTPKTVSISNKEPDVIVHDFPKPEDAYVKIRMAPKFTYGAIAIALDISGSMVWVDNNFGVGPPNNRERRLDVALRALKPALLSIPDGTHVSLTAFMTFAGNEKDGPKNKQLLAPRPWKAEMTDELIEDVKKLASRASPPPSGATTMAHLLVETAQNGFPNAAVNVNGPRVILALTDGDDNWTGEVLFNEKRINRQWPRPIDKESQKAYNTKVREFVTNEFLNKDIEIHFVCFLDKVDDANNETKESKNATAQFKEAIESDIRTKGRFIIAPDPLELADELEKAIRPRLLMVKGNESPRGFGPQGRYASLPKHDKKWIAVPPDLYTIRVRGSPEKELLLTRGDMIALALKRDQADPRKVTYERESFIDLEAESTPALAEGRGPGGRFRVGVMQNQRAPRSNEQIQSIVIEEASNTTNLIQQAVPKFVWLESKPKNAQAPRLSRWFREYGYPALTYRMIGEEWPLTGTVSAPAEITAWMTDRPDSEAYATSIQKAKKNDVIKCKDQSATIEGVSLEDKSIVSYSETQLGTRKKEQRCLIVRLAHPENRPVLVQYLGAHGGAEHHFFRTANKYTAMFWGISDVNLDTAAFNFIFLDALKKEVAPTTFTVTSRNSNFPPPEIKGR